MRLMTFAGGCDLPRSSSSQTMATSPSTGWSQSVVPDQFSRSLQKSPAFKAPHFGMEAAPPPPPPPGPWHQLPEDAVGDNNIGDAENPEGQENPNPEEQANFHTPDNAPIVNNVPPPVRRQGLVPSPAVRNLLALFDQVAEQPAQDAEPDPADVQLAHSESSQASAITLQARSPFSTPQSKRKRD